MSNTSQIQIGSCHDNLQYAIYETITERFIYCSDNYQMLANVLNVFSSRYLLCLVKLTTADNFEKNLIDNTCIHNWTDKSIFVPNSSNSQYNLFCINATHLEQADAIDNRELVVQDFEYMNYAFNVFVLLDSLSTNEYKTSSRIQVESRVRFFDDVIDVPIKNLQGDSVRYNDPVQLYTQQKKISNIFYKETNFKTAKSRVDTLINEIHPGYTNE